MRSKLHGAAIFKAYYIQNIYAPVNILPVRGGGGLTQGNLTS